MIRVVGTTMAARAAVTRDEARTERGGGGLGTRKRALQLDSTLNETSTQPGLHNMHVYSS
jgi:hypothetical protein